jgi:hypothetical protein
MSSHRWAIVTSIAVRTAKRDIRAGLFRDPALEPIPFKLSAAGDQYQLLCS